jgi:hypothetical protein
MKKLSILTISSALIYAATFINPIYEIKKGKKLLIFEYQKVNDTLDIFNLKDKELSSSFAGIGDMDGFNIKFFYGLNDKTTLSTQIQKQDIEYGSGTLTNYFFNVDSKYKFYQREYFSTAFNVGFNLNKGENLTYSNAKYLEILAKRFLNVKNIKISNNTIGIIKKDNSTEFLHLKKTPSINISNMRDTSLYLTFNAEKIFSKLALNFFTTFRYTKINTDIKASLSPADKTTENKLSKYNLNKNLDRYEHSIDIGFNATYKTPVIIEFSYLYRRIFRNKDLGYINYNHIVTLNLIKPINKQWFIYVGGKAMYRQFNGEIPYLYNKYSQTTFDHKYGWANIGIGYYF